MDNQVKIWAKRWTTSYGWKWEYQRSVLKENVNEWLEYFKKSEPTIDFKVSKNRPK